MIFNTIMQQKITLQKVIDAVKLGLCLSCFWPLSEDTIKLKVICTTLYQYITLLLNLIFTVALFNTAKNHPNDPVIMAKALMFMGATAYVVFSIIVYRINCHRLQVINTNIFNINIFNYDMSRK